MRLPACEHYTVTRWLHFSARWQINCESCADGLIHLSCRYKRLNRSNSILRFWLSHPTDSRQCPSSMLARCIRSPSSQHPWPACLPACLPVCLTDCLPACLPTPVHSVSLCSRLQLSLSKRLLPPLVPTKLHDQLLKTTYCILLSVIFISWLSVRVNNGSNQCVIQLRLKIINKTYKFSRKLRFIWIFPSTVLLYVYPSIHKVTLKQHNTWNFMRRNKNLILRVPLNFQRRRDRSTFRR